MEQRRLVSGAPGVFGRRDVCTGALRRGAERGTASRGWLCGVCATNKGPRDDFANEFAVLSSNYSESRGPNETIFIQMNQILAETALPYTAATLHAALHMCWPLGRVGRCGCPRVRTANRQSLELSLQLRTVTSLFWLPKNYSGRHGRVRRDTASTACDVLLPPSHKRRIVRQDSIIGATQRC